MSVASVEDYLLSKSVDFRRAGSGQLLTHCFFHADDSRNGKLYINSDHGAFDCKAGSCGQQGGFRQILEHFGDQAEYVSPRVVERARRGEVLAAYVDACHARLWEPDSGIYTKYLLDRGLTLDDIEKYKIGVHPKGFMPFKIPEEVLGSEVLSSGLGQKGGRWFLEGQIVIPYISAGQPISVRGKDIAGKYVSLPGDTVHLFNQGALNDAQKVILVEGEFDALILQRTLASSPDVEMRNLRVVGLAGVASLPGGNEGFKSLMSSFKRVYIGFDSDEAGRKGAQKIRELLGAPAKVLDIPVEGMDWTDFLNDPDQVRGWADVQEIIREAENRDRRVFSAADVFAATEEEAQAAEGLRLGYPSLDAFFARGLRPGQIVVPLANTGTGKSLFIQNVVYNTRHVPSLMITPELTRAEFGARMTMISRFHHPLISRPRDVAELFPLLGVVDENAVTPDHIRRFIEDYQETHSVTPEVIYVDYLGYMARYAKGNNEYEKITNAIMDFKAICKEYGAVGITPHQVNREGSPGEAPSVNKGRGGGTVEETSDVMLGLWAPWMGEVSDGKVGNEFMVRILKSRHGNLGRQAQLYMSSMSLAIVDPRADQAGKVRVELENDAKNRSLVSYEEWVRARRADAERLRAERGKLPF